MSDGRSQSSHLGILLQVRSPVNAASLHPKVRSSSSNVRRGQGTHTLGRVRL